MAKWRHTQLKSPLSRVSMSGLPSPPGSQTVQMGLLSNSNPPHQKNKNYTECHGPGAAGRLRCRRARNTPEANVPRPGTPWVLPKWLCMYVENLWFHITRWISKPHSKENQWQTPEVKSFTAVTTQLCPMHRAEQVLHPRRFPVPSTTQGFLIQKGLSSRKASKLITFMFAAFLI